ncbi:hypothetical protein MIND_00534400 [Mycena indigotica]|uniref:Uncharacterized protein n=1 Tax=Mycena indigotica TaxID=2126181 RepID=A0A8H6SZ22_9AGAR|nr:uncharacterized protein MIND_00534400 [Mycena indigotica]KAF7307402.1 hypothetical protein MIND_00534400 [Mycena indigotica]
MPPPPTAVPITSPLNASNPLCNRNTPRPTVVIPLGKVQLSHDPQKLAAYVCFPYTEASHRLLCTVLLETFRKATEVEWPIVVDEDMWKHVKIPQMDCQSITERFRQLGRCRLITLVAQGRRKIDAAHNMLETELSLVCSVVMDRHILATVFVPSQIELEDAVAFARGARMWPQAIPEPDDPTLGDFVLSTLCLGDQTEVWRRMARLVSSAVELIVHGRIPSLNDLIENSTMQRRRVVDSEDSEMEDSEWEDSEEESESEVTVSEGAEHDEDDKASDSVAFRL